MNLQICDCSVNFIFDSVIYYGMLALMGSGYRSLYCFDCIFRTCIAAIEINVFCFHVFFYRSLHAYPFTLLNF